MTEVFQGIQVSKILKAGERNTRKREKDPNTGFGEYNKTVDLSVYLSSSLIHTF